MPKATRIDLFSISTPQMRAFHMSWLAFFSVFFAWFGIAPLMPLVREDLGLTQGQIGNTIVASVAATVLVRVLIGPLCDRYGARIVYTLLLMLGSIPVMTIGLADSYESFLLFRLAIGCIGAAFVITQYHTSVMFAPNCVGTANATTAGWGNLGGGVTQIMMPLVLAGFVMLGASEASGWRLAMVVPGIVLFALGIAYYFLTQDSPEGNYRDIRQDGELTNGGSGGPSGFASFRTAARDRRVWALFVVYAACFGIELTINNVAALYFHDRFDLGLRSAGMVAGLFGLMNIFARTLGGYFSDRSAIIWGLRGRVRMLFLVLLAEGAALIFFSRMGALPAAIASLLVFSLFVQMAEGATFGLVPFVNRRALGAVAGIVGAGGNVGAVMAGFLFGMESLAFETAFLYLGIAVASVSAVTLLVRFTPAEMCGPRKRYGRRSPRMGVGRHWKALEPWRMPGEAIFHSRGGQMSETGSAVGETPLRGARIGILEGRMTGELAKLVERRGGVPLIAPALREVTSPAADEVTALIDQLAAGRVQVVLFLTGVGAAALFAEADRQGRLEELAGYLQHTTNVSRGQKPWRPLKEQGVPVSITVPTPYTTDEVLATLADLPLAGKGVALLHYGERSDVLADAIRAAGGELLELCLYEWRLPDDTAPIEHLIDELIAGSVDAVLFTSKIQVRHLIQVARSRGLEGELVTALNTRSVAAAVGPTSAHELAAYGIEPRVVPENPKMGPMIVALGEYLSRSGLS